MEKFSPLVNGSSRRLPDGRKGMRRPIKIKDVEEDLCQSGERLQHGIDDFPRTIAMGVRGWRQTQEIHWR